MVHMLVPSEKLTLAGKALLFLRWNAGTLHSVCGTLSWSLWEAAQEENANHCERVLKKTDWKESQSCLLFKKKKEKRKEKKMGQEILKRDSIYTPGFRILILESRFLAAIILSASVACKGETEQHKRSPRCWKPGGRAGKAAESKDLQQHFVPMCARKLGTNMKTI